MPTYFNFSSHLWIGYALLFNGLLITMLLCCYSNGYKKLIDSIEATLLSGFLISILLNALTLLVFELLDVAFINAIYVLIAYSIITSLWLLRQPKRTFFTLPLPEFSWYRLLLYAFILVILFINGGLIEQPSDVWWHMSMANKLAMANAADGNIAHLTGVSGRYYPPLWHLNMAMLNQISGISIPVLFNSATAWVACFKVMGFYLFAMGLGRDKCIALLSALLFILIPGVGDSYLRVSAWPSHVSYTALFCLFYVMFRVIDAYKVSNENLFTQGMVIFRQNLPLLFSFAGLLAVVYFTHKAEVLWFALGVMFYAIALSVYRLSASTKEALETESLWFGLVAIAGLLIGVTMTLLNSTQLNNLLTISISILLLSLCYLQLSKTLFIYNKSIARLLLLLVIGLLILSIDLRQLLSLFNTELSYPMAASHEASLQALGWFGEQLLIPGWHLQLRGALLYSGVVAIVVALFLVLVEQNRLTLFLAANALLTFLFLISPYLYQWLNDTISYHSCWRISVLIFHPIILATALCYLWRVIRGEA